MELGRAGWGAAPASRARRRIGLAGAAGARGTTQPQGLGPGLHQSNPANQATIPLEPSP